MDLHFYKTYSSIRVQAKSNLLKFIVENATELEWHYNCCELVLPRVSSDKRLAGDKLFEYIHWLIMCTDVKGGQ